MNDDDDGLKELLQDVLGRFQTSRSSQATTSSEEAVTSDPPSSRRHEGWIPPPPPGHSHIPWDLFQVLMKACHRHPLPPRKDSLLPYLVIRAFPGDRGGRPLTDPNTFWESPDIFVMANQSAATAPDLPPDPYGQLEPEVPNTVYAHVWNLGRGPAINARVEFYWFEAMLTWPPTAPPPTFLGLTHVTLGPRTSENCHAVVHCPVDLVPASEGNAYVGLVVRIFCPFLDALGANGFDSAKNRHVGQLNMGIGLGGLTQLRIPLRVVAGQGTRDTQLTAVQIPPDEVPWIQLLTKKREHGRRSPSVPPVVGMTPPTAAPRPGPTDPGLNEIPDEALARRHHLRPPADPMQVTLIAKAPGITAGEALVVRVQQTDDGELVGGYTAILLP
jgi:hypothetical protein